MNRTKLLLIGLVVAVIAVVFALNRPTDTVATIKDLRASIAATQDTVRTSLAQVDALQRRDRLLESSLARARDTVIVRDARVSSLRRSLPQRYPDSSRRAARRFRRRGCGAGTNNR